MSAGASVRLRGALLTGFQKGELSLSLDELSAGFSLDYATRQGRAGDEPTLRAGDAVEVLLGEELLVSGYVDAIDMEDQPEGLVTRAQGRSKTCDLLDCTAEHAQMRGKNALEIVRALCEPFGVAVQLVTAGADVAEPFGAWSVQRGETVADAIQRVALKRGLYAYAVGDRLVLGRAGQLSTETRLVRGEPPLLSASYTESWAWRYSIYVFRGQLKATDRVWGKDAAQAKHAVHDEGVTRYRPLLLQAEAHSRGELLTRAEVEMRQRRGRAERLSVTLAGHRTAEAQVWRPNLLVHVQHPMFGIDEPWLVCSVHLRFGVEEPDLTELELARPEAYVMSSDPELKRATRGRGK